MKSLEIDDQHKFLISLEIEKLKFLNMKRLGGGGYLDVECEIGWSPPLENSQNSQNHSPPEKNQTPSPSHIASLIKDAINLAEAMSDIAKTPTLPIGNQEQLSPDRSASICGLTKRYRQLALGLRLVRDNLSPVHREAVMASMKAELAEIKLMLSRHGVFEC